MISPGAPARFGHLTWMLVIAAAISALSVSQLPVPLQLGGPLALFGFALAAAALWKRGWWLAVFPVMSLCTPTLFVLSERFGAAEGIRVTDLFIAFLAMALLGTIRMGQPLCVAGLGQGWPLFRLALLVVVSSLASFLLGLVAEFPTLTVADQYVPYSARTAGAHLGKKLEYLVLFMAVVAFSRTPGAVGAALLGLMVTGGVAAGWGVFQLLAGLNLDANQAGAIVLPFHNLGGTAGIYFSMLLPLALARNIVGPPAYRRCYLVFTLLLALVLLFTNSRAALGGAVVGMLVVSAAVMQRPRLERGVYSVLSILLLVGAVCVIIASSTWITQRIWVGVQAIASGGNLEEELSLLWRLQTWNQVLVDVWQSPLIGHGPGSILAADNAYIRALHENGILGLSFFIAFLWQAVVLGWRLGRQHPDSRYMWLYTGYAGTVAGMAVSNLLSDNFLSIRVMEGFWYLTGLLVASIAMEPRSSYLNGPDPGGKAHFIDAPIEQA